MAYDVTSTYEVENTLEQCRQGTSSLASSFVIRNRRRMLESTYVSLHVHLPRSLSRSMSRTFCIGTRAQLFCGQKEQVSSQVDSFPLSSFSLLAKAGTGPHRGTGHGND
jgi:hypothetical protein